MPISVATRMPPVPEFLGFTETFRQCREYGLAKLSRASSAIKDEPIRDFVLHPPDAFSLTAAGAGLMVAASLAARCTLVPGLLEITRHSVEVGAVMGAFPLVGRVLELGIGQAGVIGAMLPAGAFLAVTSALLVCRGPVASTTGWVAAHIAIGIALGPLWMSGVCMTPGCVALVGLSTFISSQMLTRRLLEGRTTWPQTLLAVGATLVAAPVGAQLAVGKSVACVLGTAGMVASLSAVAMGIYFCVQAIDSLTDTRSPLIKSWEVPPLTERRLNLRHEPDGDIYGISERLEDMLHALRAYRQTGAPLGLRRLCFTGPRGSGRALVARGIARFLDVQLVAPRADAILRDKEPAAFVKRIFDQARVQVRRQQAPLILFFGDFDALVGNHDPEGGAASPLYATFSHEMSLDVNTDDQDLIVILGMPAPLKLTESFWLEHFGALDVVNQGRLIADQVKQVFETSALRSFAPYQPKSDAVDAWAATADKEGWTGEQTHARIEWAITSAAAVMSRREKYSSDVVTRCLDEHLDKKRSSRSQRPPVRDDSSWIVN